MDKEEIIKTAKRDLRNDWLAQEKFLFETHQAYDKTIISIVSASLILSIKLIGEFDMSVMIINFISIGILFLFLSLISVLFSYYFGIKSYRKNMDNIIKTHEDLSKYGELGLGNLPKFVDRCNFCSGLFLVLGGLSIFIHYLVR